MFETKTLGAKMRLIAMFGAAATIAVALTGQFALLMGRNAANAAADQSVAQRYQMSSDQAHDAIRADVFLGQLQALKKNAAGVEEARKDLAQHRDLFTSSLDSAKNHIKDTVVLATLPKLAADVVWYASLADSVMAVVMTDSAQTNARQSRFVAAFKQLETEMGAFGDQIEGDGRTLQQSAVSSFGTARTLIWTLFGASFVGLLWYSWRTSQSVGARMTRISQQIAAVQVQGAEAVSAALNALARGEVVSTSSMNVARIRDTAPDELGAVACAIDAMADESDASLAACQAAQNAVSHTVVEIERLAGEARIGKLDGRANSSKVHGRYATLLQGVEGLVDAIASPLREARKVLEAIADRDLEVRMNGKYAGEFEVMQTALNRAGSQLSETIGNVRAAAREVDNAAEQVASGSQSLAVGASSQAASAEEIGAALVELTSVAQRTASNASEVRAMAGEAQTSVHAGAASMRALGEDMQRIKESAGATQRIVKTIDAIAFQTNLLALNAAVEAARAGDAGRGFAVVAEEVRALAIRSAEAAKQTAELIEEEIRNVAAGVARETDVRAQLDATRENVERMGVVIEEITQAADQQARGISDISKGVSHMNDITQQAAANAEEGAAASEELLGQAAHLAEAVSGFNTRANGERSDRPSRGSTAVKSTARRSTQRVQIPSMA